MGMFKTLEIVAQEIENNVAFLLENSKYKESITVSHEITKNPNDAMLSVYFRAMFIDSIASDVNHEYKAQHFYQEGRLYFSYKKGKVTLISIQGYVQYWLVQSIMRIVEMEINHV